MATTLSVGQLLDDHLPLNSEVVKDCVILPTYPPARVLEVRLTSALVWIPRRTTSGINSLQWLSTIPDGKGRSAFTERFTTHTPK